MMLADAHKSDVYKMINVKQREHHLPQLNIGIACKERKL